MKKIMFNDRFGLTEAVLSSSKTMTRRIVTETEMVDRVYVERPHIIWCEEYESFLVFKGWDETDPFFIRPRYKPGEVVAVAQSYDKFRWPAPQRSDFQAILKSAGWRNKMYVRAELMPHAIRITSVRVERLQDISDEDCLREGIFRSEPRPGVPSRYAFDTRTDQHGDTLATTWYTTARGAFSGLIDKISGKGTWASNPWVFAYEFELVM